MKTLIQFGSKTVLSCLLFLSLLMAAGTAPAKVTSVLLGEDFSSGGFPPGGWYTDGFGNWHQSSYGKQSGEDGGFNGSAMFDMYNACDYSGSENLYTPQIDASSYNTTGSSVTLDLDYYMEQNANDYYNGGNHLVIYVNDGQGNQQQLEELWTNQNYTFDNSGDYNNDYPDPLTDPSYWAHRKYTIPASYCTSTMSFSFFGEAYYTCNGGNFGIDNVIVTGILPQNISFSPVTLTFGSILIGQQTGAQCVTLTNSSSADVQISSIQVTGAQYPDYPLSGAVPTVIPANGTADVCVIFAPQNSGARLADLIINNNSDNNPSIDIPLTGIGAAPIIEIDPIGSVNTSTKMFKKTFTKLGGTLMQSLLIKNIGQGNLIIDPATNLGGSFPGEYTITKLPVSPIAPNQTDTVSIAYHPTMEGSHPAKLFIQSNAANGISIVDLFGIGKLPKILVMPSVVNFDSVIVGDKVCKTITISNPGSDTLIIKENYLSSNDGDFVYSGLSREQSIIPPETSRDVSLCFTPKQRGARQARLTIITNIPMTFENQRRDTGTATIDITGTGVPFGQLSITLGGASTLDSALVGSPVCHQATIDNTGNADLTVTSATISGNGASDFTISGVTLPVTIPAQRSIAVNICATPSARGLRQGMLTLKGNSAEKPLTASIPLAVFGEIGCDAATPTTLFDGVKVLKGNSDTASVVVKNCGDIASTYTATISGDGYTILSPAGGVSGSIAPGATTLYQIIFNPTTTGLKTGNLLITSPDVSNINVPLSGEGACATLSVQSQEVPKTGVNGSSTFDVTITNAGNFDWTPGIGTITPSGVFAVLSVTPTTIPAGMTGDVKVQFSPKAMGLITAELTFPNAGPCEESAVKVDFTGEGITNSVKQTITANGFSLDQNYPNPFVNSTTFNYTLPTDAAIRITLSDMTGKIVKELVSGRVSQGDHSVTFDASQLSSGTYVYTLESGNTKLSKDLVLTK